MKILVTHPSDDLPLYYGDTALAALRQIGEVVTNPGAAPFDAEGLIDAAQGCQVIVADRQTPVPQRVVEALPHLVAVHRCAMDVSNIDISAADRCGVLVTRASAGFIDSVAELAIGFIIDLARGISDAVHAYRSGQVPPIRIGTQLSASSLGIIGYGAIGERLGVLAQALGMQVLASDPRMIEAPGIEQVDLPSLLSRSKFVVCLAPAIPATRNMIDAAALAAMQPGSYFINLSRSSLVDEVALEQALESGRLAGAALDVGSAPDQKPPPGLAAHPRVVATPHIGGLTPQAAYHQAFDTVRQAEAVAAGRIPEGTINPASGVRLRQAHAPPL